MTWDQAVSAFLPGFDLPHTVQDFLPHIAFGLEFGKCLAGQLFRYFECLPI